MRTDRKWELVLYPDAENYNCQEVILKAQSFFESWAYVLHDCDITDDGTPKKSHYHFLGKQNTTITPSGICYHLGIPENSLTNIKSWKGAVRYLIHADSPEKHQYEIESVSSNFNLSPYFALKEDDTSQAKIIYSYIQEVHPTLNELVEFVLDNNLWSAFRRGFAVWSQLIIKKENYNYGSHRYP